MPSPADRRAKKLSALSRDVRKTADKLESIQSTIRQEGVGLALVRFRERQGERAAIVDLTGAASTLRAYAAILESSCRAIEQRVKSEAVETVPPNTGTKSRDFMACPLAISCSSDP